MEQPVAVLMLFALESVTSRRALLVALALTASGVSAGAEEFRIEEVASLATAQLKPNVIAFTDHRKDDIADPATGLIRFEDWARLRPTQKQLLGLYPGYVEPTVEVTVGGVTKPQIEKLQMYVAEARFVLSKPAASINLARYAVLPFLQQIDPAITHKLIAATDVLPPKEVDPEAHRPPDRHWCDPRPASICIQSSYALEGKLPVGIRLVNKLTGINAPATGALEQNIFYVNQILRFGKFFAVLQPHPSDPNRTVASAYVALAIKAKVLENRKEYEGVPILRNLVPAQVLVGNSSFNTGKSISAGLPVYARNQIKAVATILERQ